MSIKVHCIDNTTKIIRQKPILQTKQWVICFWVKKREEAMPIWSFQLGFIEK